MSDLPRFHTGEVGRLDFTALNEMMRRLDLLLPLIESAGLQESRDLKQKPEVFLVKAEQVGGSSSGRYAWREVVVSPSDKLLVETDDEWDTLDDFDVAFRSGGFQDGDDEESEERYAVLADPTAFFQEGLAICFALGRADRVKRYVLVPFATDPGPAFFVVTGGGGETTIELSDDLSVQAVTYSGKAYTPTEDGWTEQDATVYDLSVNNLNEPVTNAPAVDIEYHTLGIGTCLSPNWVDSSTGYFGAPPRLDFNCKG